jgi:hypothetical protein
MQKLVLSYDAGAATRHRPRGPLVYVDIAADPAQGDAGAQTSDRASSDGNLDHPVVSETFGVNFCPDPSPINRTLAMPTADQNAQRGASVNGHPK